jgi:preprotein translocase subunit YajC
MGTQVGVPAKGQTQSQNPLVSFVPMIFVMAVIYFLLIRPQQRAQKDLKQQVDSIKTGDKVLVNGIYGTVSAIRGDIVSIRVAEGKMDVSRQAINKVFSDSEKVGLP